MSGEHPAVLKRVERRRFRVALFAVLSLFATGCASPAALARNRESPPDASIPAALTSAHSAIISGSVPIAGDLPASEASAAGAPTAMTASATPFPSSPTPTGGQSAASATPVPSQTRSPQPPTYTPTSRPGQPVLLEPAEGATLPQPVGASAWEFVWSARMGPCCSSITIDGPGGRTLGSSDIPWQGSGYRYSYSGPDPLPDDALGPWSWFVEVRCPAGWSRSETRSFWVEPSSYGTPTVTPVDESPGLVVRGFVRLEDGTGLPNVRIYRAFAGYMGDVVASTNADGYYESAFQFIPGEEMVRVWAQAEGHLSGPDGVSGTLWEDGQYLWRHYYGREQRSLGFVAIPATPASPTVTPPPPTSPTVTPTSRPGPAVLLQPADGATLPQPVAPGEWVFTWTGRTGPCSSMIRIDGPGGRQIGYTVVSAQGGQYSYRYSAAEPLPDDALWPWNWSVDIVCPAGMSRSDPRTFRVMSAAPTSTPAVP